jgi:hypothetical protein
MTCTRIKEVINYYTVPLNLQVGLPAYRVNMEEMVEALHKEFCQGKLERQLIAEAGRLTDLIRNTEFERARGIITQEQYDRLVNRYVGGRDAIYRCISRKNDPQREITDIALKRACAALELNK